MPRSEFNVQRGVFRVFKDYTIVNGNTWLRPRMESSYRTGYHPLPLVGNNSRPCMEIHAGEGEPDIRERPLEELPGLENFNEFYTSHGGVVCSLPWRYAEFQGGGINDLPFRPIGASRIMELEQKEEESKLLEDTPE